MNNKLKMLLEGISLIDIRDKEKKLPRQALSLMWDTVRLITCCGIQVGDNCYQMLTVS